MERVTEVIMKSFKGMEVNEQVLRSIIDKEVKHKFNGIEYQVIDEAIKRLQQNQFIRLSMSGDLILQERGFEAINE